jgi:hypothetical protein
LATRPFRAILIAMRSVLALAAYVLATAGCGKQVNLEYCESALHQDDPICHNASIFLDAAIDAAISCSGNPAACTGTQDPVCDTSQGICVQCMLNTQCSLQLPICDLGTETCRGCAVDNECPGAGARCLPDGTCADQSELVYVDSAGPDDGDCSLGNPCNTLGKGIQTAIAAGKHLISATGQFQENVKFDNVAPLSLICAPGTKLSGNDDQQPILEFVGAAIADVYRLTIDGAQNRVAVVRLTMPGTQKVGLHEVAVTGPPGAQSQTGTRTPAPGIEVASGSLKMERSIVSGFETVGVQFDAGAGEFDVENNFIDDNGYQKNGAGGTPYGGVAILNNAATSTFAWNTVAFNGNTNNGNAPGVYCASGVETGIGNLFFHNQGGSSNEYSPTCQITVSLQGTDPKFKAGATAPYDLHLTTGSTAVVDKAQGGCANLLDIDRESRPFGAQCDYGADEYH